MSGLGKTGLGKQSVSKLPKRPELSNGRPYDVSTTPKQNLPYREYLKVEVNKLSKYVKQLARVKRKGWIILNKWPTLTLEVSDYILNAPFSMIDYNRTKKQKQALQVCLHELMHVALWDDLSIIHSNDPDSLLHFYVEGDTLSPSPWDMEQMKEAANRIGFIEINANKLKGDPLTTFYLTLSEAVSFWNFWLGRDLFKLL